VQTGERCFEACEHPREASPPDECFSRSDTSSARNSYGDVGMARVKVVSCQVNRSVPKLLAPTGRRKSDRGCGGNAALNGVICPPRFRLGSGPSHAAGLGFTRLVRAWRGRW
jgi:hypothetical protein